MITDPDTIKHLGERNRDTNFRFRSYLKSKDGDRLDRTVKELYQFYSAKIDCTLCGNCCSLLKPIIQETDIKTLALIKSNQFGTSKGITLKPMKMATSTLKIYPVPSYLIKNVQYMIRDLRIAGYTLTCIRMTFYQDYLE